MKLPQEIRCSLDQVTVTSKSRIAVDHRYLKLPTYKFIGKSKNKRKGKHIKNQTPFVYSYDFLSPDKRKIVKIYPVVGEEHVIPTFTVKFFSSFFAPLEYREVVAVLNHLTNLYGFSWRLSGFHLATDLVFGPCEDRLQWILDHTKALKSINPEPCPTCPETFHYHSMHSRYRLTTYNKTRDLLTKNKQNLSRTPRKRRIILTRKEEAWVQDHNVVRMEARFNNTEMKIVSTVEALATHDFSFVPPDKHLIPYYISIRVPDYRRLARHGISLGDCKNMSLAQMKRLFTDHGIPNNHGYYLKDSRLNTAIMDTLSGFRWCPDPKAYPLTIPALRIRDQHIRFIRKKGWWKQ